MPPKRKFLSHNFVHTKQHRFVQPNNDFAKSNSSNTVVMTLIYCRICDYFQSGGTSTELNDSILEFGRSKIQQWSAAHPVT